MSEQPTSRPRPPMVPSPPQGGLKQITATGGGAAIDRVAAGGIGAINREEYEKATHPLVRIPGPTGKISKAIANVMKVVGTVKRRGHNEFFNYNYARFEDLLYAITPLMGENGLAITQSEISVTQEKNTLTVKYEFVVYHESGESYPPQVHTGMSLLLTRKGTYDDKAINKCHTQARKYFFQGLFNVPTGDFEDNDADGGDANQRQQKPVPGPPKGANVSEALAAGAKVTSEGGGGSGGSGKKLPQRIGLGEGAGPDEWATTYIRMIGQTETVEEITAWDTQNDKILQMLSDQHSAIYERIDAAVQRRLADLSPGMPDPKKDAQESMNWIAGQLAQMNTLTGAVAFWNDIVAPREADFDTVDWGMLSQEWVRTRERLSGSPQDAA